MAKRVPPGQGEYRPVDEHLARTVLNRRRSSDDDNGRPREAAIAEGQPVLTQKADNTLSLVPAQRVEQSQGDGTQATPETPATGKREPVRAKRRDMVREKRMLLTEKEEERFEELVAGIARELRAKVKASNVLRACLTLLVNVEGELRRQCRRVGQDREVKRPRYDEPTQIVAFEDLLARIFDTAIRNAKSYD